jgi:diguanylate cyclase
MRHRPAPAAGLFEEFGRQRQACMLRCRFMPRPPLTEEHRTRLAAALRLALTEDALHVEYQPLVRADGSMFGLEALIRWHLPDGTSAAPSQILQLAHGCGFTHELTDALLDEVVSQVVQWRASCRQVPPVSVNLSARDLEREDLAASILQRLEVNGLPPRTLAIEITESELIRHYEIARPQLALLRDEGVAVAIDDFGTGYSSLTQLAQLPADTLKLDGAFLRGVPGDARREAIIRAVLRMARDLALEVVAEGVELPAQLLWLANAGVSAFQGFLFHRPAAASHWTQHLRMNRPNLCGWELTEPAPLEKV